MVGVPPDASYEELTAQVNLLKKKYAGDIKKIKRIEARACALACACFRVCNARENRNEKKVAKDRIVELRLRQRAKGIIGMDAGAAMQGTRSTVDKTPVTVAVQQAGRGAWRREYIWYLTARGADTHQVAAEAACCGNHHRGQTQKPHAGGGRAAEEACGHGQALLRCDDTARSVLAHALSRSVSITAR